MTGPIIVTALFGPEDDAWLQQLRRLHYPPERNRVPAHLTLFSQLPPTLRAELSERLGRATDAPAPRAVIAGVMDLGTGTAFRVQSSGLEEIREELADAFHGLLVAPDLAPWTPHVTIQNKVEPREARRTQQLLKAGFEPRPLAIRGLASWRYEDGPWTQIRTHAFGR